MDNPFQLNPDESILYRSRPSHQWYMVAWRIGLGLLEAILFIFLSFISFTNIGKALLGTFLPLSIADGLSRLVFQGIVPVLIVVWFAEDIARIFTSEFILTNQRIWTKGSPYAWDRGHTIPLAEIKSMSARRDAIFIRLTSFKKIQVHTFPNGRQIVEAYLKNLEKSGTP